MAALLSGRPDSATADSPFQAGQGKIPPYLAGRQTEQALIRDSLRTVAKPDAPASDIILYGPRGNGKTALLEWSRREAVQLEIQVAYLQGGQIRSREQLAAALAVKRRWLEALRGLTVGASSIQSGSLPPGQVPSALARRVRRGPFLALVDEAHMLGVEAGRSLLSIIQTFQSMDLPVLLILAGTPDLPRHLRTMGVSFWVRNQRLPIGRLERGAAAAAVRVPFEERGRSIEDDALQEIVRESHRYPFFLQLWGDLLWRGSKDPSAPAARADMDAVRPLFEHRREGLDDELLEELRAAQLVSVAARVAAEFAASRQVLRERVTMAIQSSLLDKRAKSDREAALAAEQVLRHQGYIWPVVKQGIGYYEPGIPSLMQHVTRNDRMNREVRGETA